MKRRLVLAAIAIAFVFGGCKRARRPATAPSTATFAELRTIKGALLVTPPGEASRTPYPRERLTDGEAIDVPAGGLAWFRRDGGSTWLVSGPARLVARAEVMDIREGRVFVDGELGAPVEVTSPLGKIELSDARASIDVKKDGSAAVYVLRGSARAGDSERARAGEILNWVKNAKATRTPVVSWEDWTGGLATADPAAEPAPFGLGTVGARKAGENGKPRFPLVVQRLDVRVTIDRDFATTEVDEVFVNPSSDVVEGIYSFRTPERAILHRFGVDRNGDLVWGRIQEAASATRQYQSNVYEGSEEDPALLTWAGQGSYSARFYPIRPGASRRVVTRYAEWLSRQGPRGERRLYVYPLAAEGARGSLPRIEELNVTIDISRAGATGVRAGMDAERDGDRVVVKAFDFVPRADLALELFDAGQDSAVLYRAPHGLGPEDAPRGSDADFARQVSREEADYVALPLRVFGAPAEQAQGIDLAIVVDTSAATDAGALAIARSMAASLLAHLGPEDRAALWAGDATLWPVAPDSGALGTVDRAKSKAWLAGLAAVERGGATDLGALLTAAASQLDPKRRGAVVYIGDGLPSVGEAAPKALRERLARLPVTTRVLAAGVGAEPNVALLQTLVRGAPVERVADAYSAARAALKLLEAAGRPIWLGASVDLGSGVERISPRELPPIGADESVLVVGRVIGPLPASVTLRGSGGTLSRRATVRSLADQGDLRRRWGEARLGELISEGAGRSALVEAGRRFGLVSPVTSLYVPTERETLQGDGEEEEEPRVSAGEARRKRWKPWARESFVAEFLSFASMAAPELEVGTKVATKYEMYSRAEKGTAVGDRAEADKEGGTGTRAKGEEGSATAELKDFAPAEQKAASMRPGAVGGLVGPSAPPPPAATATPEPAAPPMLRQAAPADEKFEHGRLGGSHAAATADDADGTSGFGQLAGKAVRRPVTATSKPRGGGAGFVPEPVPAASAAPVSPELPSSDETAEGAVPEATAARPAIAGTGTGAGFGAGHGRMRRVAANADEPRALSKSLAGGAIGAIGHAARPCGPGADLPLAERAALWRERLAPASHVLLVFQVYRAALHDCEAARWDERALLLVQMVERLRSVSERVALWRMLLDVSPAAADAVYRFLALRVQTPAELKELHQALGLTRVEPSLLADLLKKAATPAERVAVLRGTSQRFPDDAELALLVLDAYEDAGDEAGGRAWARKLRRRVDTTAHVRTSVGEYYLRLSARAKGPQAARDAEEARRTFGELVEFAPEDPLARRRLGDLLRAHGWYDEALRQYETLAELTPDDASVPLLRAGAAQGMGRTEEAVRWAEKAAAIGSPDEATELSLAARALASAFLGWSRMDALKGGRKEEAERLRTRAARLGSTGSANAGNVRFVLSWSHPDLRPALWTNALGAPMPAADNLPLYGVAQAYLPAAPAPVVELRLDQEDAERAARLGVEAVLTAVVNEGAADERLARLAIGFRGSDGKPRAKLVVRFEGDALVLEAP
jgi:tetratricopeptide (TPR) repeat protein